MQGMEQQSGNHLVQAQFLQTQNTGFGAESGKRPGFPPAFPSPASLSRPAQPPAVGPLLLRSRSQPAFFSLDSPPTTSLSDSVSADEHDVPTSRSPPLHPKNPAAAVAPAREGLPPRTAHRRSQSDVPFAFLPSSSLSVQAAAAAPSAAGFLDPAKLAAAGVKVESHWDSGLDADGATGDDLFNAYMNLQGFDAMTSSEDNHEDRNSRESGSKTNAADSSENEADSNAGGHAGGSNTVLCAINDALRKEGMKRSAASDPAQVMTTSRHCRSLAMDSLMAKFNLEEPSKLLLSPGLRPGQSSKSNSLDRAPNTFSLEFGNGQFTAAEMKKIMQNEKLVEMAMTDPKRVKRILANRQSAARSKERKMRYIAELEHKVQALQAETTTMSAQHSLLRRDSAGLMNQNNELKFRLQAMEQQAQLRDALHEALTAEVHHLKLAAAGLADAHASNILNQQASINQMFQLQPQQQPPHMTLYQLQKQQKDAMMDDRSEQ